jgi:hypothetical protein
MDHWIVVNAAIPRVHNNTNKSSNEIQLKLREIKEKALHGIVAQQEVLPMQ